MTRSIVLLLLAALLLTTLTMPLVGASEWQGEQIIDVSLKEAHSPQVAVDGQGRAIAIWSQDVGVSNNQYRLHASVFIPGEGWGAPVMIQNDDHNVFRYALDVSTDGMVVIVHLQGSQIMYVRTFEIGSGWGMDETVYSAQGINSYIGDLCLEMNPQGDAILAWTEGHDGYESLRAMNLIDGEWGEPQIIEEGSSDISEANAALNDRGEAVAAWNVRTGDYSLEVRASNYSQGDWSSPHKISAGDDYSGTPRLGMDRDGNALVVWTQEVVENVYNAYTSNFSKVSGWSAPISLQNGTADSRAPRIAVNAAGNAVAVWQQNYGGDYCLTANVHESEAGWQGAERLEIGDSYGLLPSIGIADNGDTTVVWIEESPQAVHSISHSVGKGWGPLVNIQSTTGWVENFDLEVGADGTAAVVWEQGDDVHSAYLPSELRLTLDEPLNDGKYDGPTVKVTGQTNPGAEVMVNGIEVHVGADGRFSLNVSLTEGVNTISVVATTPYDEEAVILSVEMNSSDDDDPSQSMIILGISGWVVAAVAIVLLLRSMRTKG